MHRKRFRLPDFALSVAVMVFFGPEIFNRFSSLRDLVRISGSFLIFPESAVFSTHLSEGMQKKQREEEEIPDIPH